MKAIVGTRTGRGPLLVTGIVALVLASSPVFGQSSFRSRRDFVIGDHPVGIVATDYDADGYLDLISVNQQTNGTGDIALIKGFGDGTFRKVQSIISGTLPSCLVYTDVNGDGISDLVLSNLRSQEVTVHLGDGIGGFGPKISTMVVGTPTSLVVGDWNVPPDGRKDVAVLNAAQGNVTVLMGDNTGRFPTVRQTFAVAASSKQIISGDFNADAKADLVVLSNAANTATVYRGDGTGVFALANTLTTGAGPVAVVAADLNADARPDLVTANQTADSVSVFLANTTGGFNTPTSLSPGFGPRGMSVGDINKDGKPDLVIGLGKVAQEGQVALMIGNGTGGFTLSNTLFTGPAPNWLTLGDFNRDTNLDIITANNTGNTVSILASTGTATFLIPGRVPVPTGSFPAAVAMGDYNSDTRRDYVSANEFLNNVSFAAGDGACGFTTVSSGNNTGVTPIALVSTDFNRDGCPDLVTANNGDGTFSYLASNCAGNFTVANGNAVGCLDPIAIAAGDVNGDANTDFGIVCETSGDLCTRRGTGVPATPFGAAVCTPGAVNTPEGIAIGRFTLDAFDDYAMTSSPSPSGDPTDVVAIAKSDGAGGVLDVPATFPVGVAPRGIARADLNGDGFMDLVVANSETSTVSALLGDGGGVFSFPSIDSPAGQGPTSIVVTDFNVDGKLDVAVINTNANDISLLLGDGLGHFSPSGEYGTRDLPVALAVGDCNNDGKPDLVAADNFNDTLSILINQTITGDPLSFSTVIGQARLVYSWGVVGGGIYDVIRGQVKSIVQGATTVNLGAVSCLANDLVETDTASVPDATNPPIGDSFFYAVRATVAGTAGPYTVSVPTNKIGTPSSGGCP